MREYDEIAAWFASVRDPGVGLPDLVDFAASLPPRGHVLDLGCGAGLPVSRVLQQKGFALTALDSSAEMLARYHANFPEVPVQCLPVQEARFAPGSFDGVVAWGVLFHLTEAVQVTVIEQVAAWLRPGGRFLFTSGDVPDTSEGQMQGVTFQYVSLGAEAYRRVLARAGLRLLQHHTDAWENHVYVAVKASSEVAAASPGPEPLVSP